MGYNTEFMGNLYLPPGISPEHRRLITDYLKGNFEIDLEMSADNLSLVWNGAEKTYDMDQQVNDLIAHFIPLIPNFTLTGSMLAQGENADDRWVLYMDTGGVARCAEVLETGHVIPCPHCKQPFEIPQGKDR